mmetsp:Transcript_34428/g.106913  ORF Transcript_34428/g.106913 Transcript_34428/m.106913 type:complete len:203 (+) Transcript_34428:771-1379(+)
MAAPGQLSSISTGTGTQAGSKELSVWAGWSAASLPLDSSPSSKLGNEGDGVPVFKPVASPTSTRAGSIHSPLVRSLYSGKLSTLQWEDVCLPGEAGAGVGPRGGVRSSGPSSLLLGVAVSCSSKLPMVWTFPSAFSNWMSKPLSSACPPCGMTRPQTSATGERGTVAFFGYSTGTFLLIKVSPSESSDSPSLLRSLLCSLPS